jgi:proteasome lid subunit RPN8/RPN11
MTDASKLIISQDNLDQIMEHARQGMPYEVCGLIGGRDDLAETVVAVPNASLTPRTSFEMERQAMVDTIIAFQRAGLVVVAIYHSHPDGSLEPSATDVAQATWPDAVTLIVGLDEQGNCCGVRAWTIRAGQVETAALDVT